MRSRRKHPTRAWTLKALRTTSSELERIRTIRELDERLLPVIPPMPRTRGECEGGCRPCPYVRCKFNLYLDVNATTGSVKVNFPDVEVWEMGESCVLDVADRGGITLEDVGAIMNVTRERIRQIEVLALARLEGNENLAGIGRDLAEPDDSGSGLELRAVLRRGPA